LAITFIYPLALGCLGGSFISAGKPFVHQLAMGRGQLATLYPSPINWQ